MNETSKVNFQIKKRSTATSAHYTDFLINIKTLLTINTKKKEMMQTL